MLALERSLAIALALAAAGTMACNTTQRRFLPRVPQVAARAQLAPETCLALSGGGLRSGAVSLGVLQELHQDGTLSEIDMVASVSGGGYAVYGLLYQMTKFGTPIDELLGEDSAYIRAIETTPFIDDNDLFAILATTTLLAPLELLLWMVRGGDVPFGTTAHNLYGEAIRDTFANDRFFLTKPSLSEVGEEVIAGFPYPVFIAAAHPGRRPPSDVHNYSIDDLFELSPNWIGSPSLGYTSDYSSYLTLEHAIVASASAIDSPRTDNCVSVPVSGGECVDNQPKLSLRGSYPPLPALLKSTGYTTGVTFAFNGSSVYVADGSFVETLGVLPLIRKGCSQIIALDATHDPELDFPDLRILKQFLQRMGGDLSIPEDVDPFSEGSAWEIAKNYSRLSATLNEREVTIHYLKLGLDKAHLAQYPTATRTYAAANWEGSPLGRQRCVGYPPTRLDGAPTCGPSGSMAGRTCSFPHEETFRLCYEADEFAAYRELGRFLARQIPPLDSRDVDRSRERRRLSGTIDGGRIEFDPLGEFPPR